MDILLEDAIHKLEHIWVKMFNQIDIELQLLNSNEFKISNVSALPDANDCLRVSLGVGGSDWYTFKSGFGTTVSVQK